MTDPQDPAPEHSDEALAQALEALLANPARLAAMSQSVRKRLLMVAGQLSRPSMEERRRLRKELRKRDRALVHQENQKRLQTAQLRKERLANKADGAQIPKHALPSLSSDAIEAAAQAEAEHQASPAVLLKQRFCYVCKAEYRQVHHFYDSMCCACGDFNYGKRGELADLRGMTALVTGGRVKIGQQIVWKLLRCGAKVIVTTRFPVDAAERYAREATALGLDDAVAQRLQVHGLDLRHTPSVEAFADALVRSEPRLDFIINNACQTVRRPPAFYAHMMDRELSFDASAKARGLLEAFKERVVGGAAHALLSAPARAALSSSAALSQLVHDDAERHMSALFPQGALDVDMQQVDLRKVNSWRLRLHEVATSELLEVQLVNAIAPYVLNARLKPLMVATANLGKHIVNVSAMEGQFTRGTKTDRHPHTNMAKAALNMMTRTSAQDYVKDHIYMNSVDTGWVTDEDPAELALRKEQEQGFAPPLDIIDGAARVLDPIVSGTNTGQHVRGLFLKDYKPAHW